MVGKKLLFFKDKKKAVDIKISKTLGEKLMMVDFFFLKRMNKRPPSLFGTLGYVRQNGDKETKMNPFAVINVLNLPLHKTVDTKNK